MEKTKQICIVLNKNRYNMFHTSVSVVKIQGNRSINYMNCKYLNVLFVTDAYSEQFEYA